MRRTRLTAFALSAALVAFAGPPSSHAQSPEDNQPGAQFQAGQDALANGNYRAAVRHFAKVLRNSELESAAVAKALYMRGVAHEKAGQPAQAIADITSALYLSGLSSAERAKAYLSRGKAYEAVGMSDRARADISRARSGGVSEQQIARSSEPSRSSGGGGGVPAFATTVAPSGGSASTATPSTRSGSRRTRETVPTFATSSQTTASQPAATARTSTSQRTASFQTRSRAPAREEQIPQFRTSILPQETRTPPPPARAQTPPPTRTARSSGSAPAGWDTSVAQQQQPATAPAQTQEDESGSRVGRWFRGLRDNVTGRGDTEQTAAAPAAQPSPTPTASDPPQWRQTTSAARAPQPSWSSQVSAPSPSPRTAAAPQAVPPATAPRPTSGASGYRIQLAALRSDAEAQATWKRLQAKHGALLGSYQPSIVKTELGGLGTFYRVQLGPFADKAATQQLCKSFKSNGLDCFLLAQ